MCVTIFRPRVVSVLYCLSQVWSYQLKMTRNTSLQPCSLSLSLSLALALALLLLLSEILNLIKL